MSEERPTAGEALCPGCGKPATRTLAIGWLFRCDPCDWEWGHDQHIDRAKASALLHDAKAAAGDPR